MMGQSTTIASAFAAILILFSIFMINSTSINSIQSITTTADLKAAQLESLNSQKCRLENWGAIDQTTIILNVTNTGDKSIRWPEFDAIEIYAKANANDTSQVQRIQFNQEIAVGGYWEVSHIFYNGNKEEIKNPLIIATKSGAWDPGETLEIKVHLSFNSEGVNYMTLVLPNGFESSLGLINSITQGFARITIGSTNITINHNLGSLPRNIQVTPTNRLLSGFWISNITSSTFLINIDIAEDTDVGFYWKIYP
jgi:hypothetical protein